MSFVENNGAEEMGEDLVRISRGQKRNDKVKRRGKNRVNGGVATWMFGMVVMMVHVFAEIPCATSSWMLRQ